MVSEHYQVTLHKEMATVDASGQVVALTDNMQLPCPVGDEGCFTERSGTYIWTKPTKEESCPFYLNRDVEGVEVTDLDKRPVFISNDGSMVRLRRGGAQSHCGGVVYETDYHRLFLADLGGDGIQVEAFRRPIHPSSMSLVTYANQQDSFLFHQLIQEIHLSTAQARAERCKEQKERKTAAYARRAAEQHAIVDGETVQLGPGQFVTAAGEAWYHYFCRPRVVQAREAEGCYAAMPVQMTTADFDVYLSERDHQVDRAKSVKEEEGGMSLQVRDDIFLTPTNQFFLEPRTHRLVTVSIPSVCATPFSPLYRNLRGDWIAYEGRHFTTAPTPDTIESVRWDFAKPAEIPDYDFEKGGIYTANQIQRMDVFMQVSQAGKGVLNTMSRSLHEQVKPDQSFQAHQLFPGIPVLSDPIMGKMLNWLLKWLRVYGNACSILVATCLMYRFFSWVIGVVLRLATIPLTGNLCVHIIGAFFPSFREFLRAPAQWCRKCCGLAAQDDRDQPPPYQPPSPVTTRQAWIRPILRRRASCVSEPSPHTVTFSRMPSPSPSGDGQADHFETEPSVNLNLSHSAPSATAPILREDTVVPTQEETLRQEARTLLEGLNQAEQRAQMEQAAAPSQPATPETGRTLLQAAVDHAARAVFPGTRGEYAPVVHSIPPLHRQ